MRRWMLQLVVCLALVSECSVEAQKGTSRLAPAPGPRAPTSRTFLSANRKYQLVLEETTLPPMSGPRDVRINASIAEEIGNNRVTVWGTNFDGQPVQYYSEGDAIVSDAGDFFLLITGSGGDVTLYTKTFRRRLYSSVAAGSSLFLTQPQKLVRIDTIDGEKVIGVWSRDANQWEAYRVRNGAPNSISQEIATKWTEETRQDILNLLYADKREQMRRRVSEISKPLGKLANATTGTNSPALGHVHYEFLTLQRNREDRHWIEELAFADNGASANKGRGFSTVMAWPWATDQYLFSELDIGRLRGDWLLAIWDKKLTNGMRPFAGDAEGDLPRFYLGKVAGKVRFPVPLNIYPSTKPTVLHVHLIKESAKDSAEHLTGSIFPAGQWRDIDVVDEASFKFSTVLPGTYRLKVIWDKRAPFTDADAAGAGDYVGEVSAPIVVSAGGAVSNLIVYCTNRVEGGESYYRADNWIATNWRAGRIARFTYTPDAAGRVDIVTKPASEWLVATNFVDPKQGIEIATIGLRTPKKASNEELDHGNELIVSLRRTTEWSRQYTVAPEVVIKDEHGCSYPAKSMLDGQLISYTFWNFPRSAEGWRIICYSRKEPELDLQARTMLDVNVTNLVRTAPRELRAQSLPAEIDLGPVQMKIAFAGLDFRSPSIAATFYENGKATEDWRITEARVVDRHGNFIGARDMCRTETKAILIGRVGKGPAPRKTLPFEICLARDNDSAAGER